MTMPATLNLEASKKVREVLGEGYDTEWVSPKGVNGWQMYRVDDALKLLMKDKKYPYLERPTFQELIRLMGKIADKAKWPFISNCPDKLTLESVAEDFLWTYINQPTPEEAMERISKRLMEII